MKLNNRVFLGEKQTLDIKSNLGAMLRSVDLNYQGGKNLILENRKANVNRVLFWLTSKKLDFVREPSKGGYLYSMMGTLSNTSNLDIMAEQLKVALNSEFAGDLECIYSKLNSKFTEKGRSLEVNLIVRDLLDNNLYTISEVAYR